MRNPLHANFVPNIALQVIHTLTHWSSGEWKPPTGRAGYFSEDNYGDTEVFRDGKMCKDKRLTHILDVCNDLSDDEWDAIINVADEVFCVRHENMKGGKKKKLPPAIREDAESDDEGVMLIE